MLIRRAAKETLTAVEMLHGDILEFRLLNGKIVYIKLVDTGAEIMATNLKTPKVVTYDGWLTYRFWGDFEIDGEMVRLEREVGTQKSFYEPWVIAGVRLWLDAVDAIFEFLSDDHSPCRLNENNSKELPPRNHARLALQDATARICPEELHPWCPLPEGGLNIKDCFQGFDCWMGAFAGAEAHGGLDINHPRGTPLYAPIDLDDHVLYKSIEMGSHNNYWRGMRHWPDGSYWILLSAHMERLTIPDHTPLKRGCQYAAGAGVWVWQFEHSHFAFTVLDQGELIRLDPWILFWQMYQDADSSQQHC